MQTATPTVSLVGTPRCGVTARIAGGIPQCGTVQHPTTLDCAAKRGADGGGSATCEERRPYRPTQNENV